MVVQICYRYQCTPKGNEFQLQILMMGGAGWTLPLCKISSPKNNSGVSCQLGGKNITLYLIWLGTPHCPSAIVQARSSCPHSQALSYLLLPSCTTPLACLPSQILASPLSQCQGCCASRCRCGPMHSSSAWLRKMWYGLREAFWQPPLGGGTTCWPWSARSCARSQA